jgi:hypothetical protein
MPRATTGQNIGCNGPSSCVVTREGGGWGLGNCPGCMTIPCNGNGYFWAPLSNSQDYQTCVMPEDTDCECGTNGNCT